MFQGFTEQTPAFLWELKFNNEKPWFLAHKDEFERLVDAPMKELMREVTELMNLRRPEPGFQSHISRIYRDARRLFGRGPYKDHLWFSLHSADVDRHGPGFWFEIGPAGYSLGMGWYEITPAQMEAFRAGIDAEPARFRRLAEELERCGVTHYGVPYSRPKGHYGEPVDAWYNRRSVGCGYDRDFGGAVLETGLPQYICDEFEKLLPMYDYLRELYHRTASVTTEEKP